MLAMAEEQWRLVTRQQVEAADVAWSAPSRKARTGVLERVDRGVVPGARGRARWSIFSCGPARIQLMPEIPAWERIVDRG